MRGTAVTLALHTPEQPHPREFRGHNTYDIENRLVSSSIGAALSYDPLGRLYEVSLGGNTARFLYDGDALVAEYNGAGAMAKRYAHWVGQPAPAEAGVPMVSYEGASLATATARCCSPTIRAR